MNMDDYQQLTATTAVYPDAGYGSAAGVEYVLLGLLGEAGELANKYKKFLRGDVSGPDALDKIKDILGPELGDVLWYVSQLSTELGFELSDLAKKNLDKLADRKQREVLKGSGDYR